MLTYLLRGDECLPFIFPLLTSVEYFATLIFRKAAVSNGSPVAASFGGAVMVPSSFFHQSYFPLTGLHSRVTGQHLKQPHQKY